MNAPTETFALTAQEAQQWQDDGFFIRHHQFDDQELARLRAAADTAATLANHQAANGKTYFLDSKRFVDVGASTVQYEYQPGSSTVRVLEPVHLFAGGFDRLIDDARLAAPMIGLVGCDTLALWTAKLNMKTASGSGFGWHQDSPYWIHDHDDVEHLPNVMVALDAQSPANGCFRVIRGSHRHGILAGTDDGSQLGGFYTDPQCFDLADEIPMQVDAGALIFFHPHSVHGSLPNQSAQPRRALIFTYQPGGLPMLKNGEVREVAI